jgi:peptide-methionine (R)-S-oxide reductase
MTRYADHLTGSRRSADSASICRELYSFIHGLILIDMKHTQEGEPQSPTGTREEVSIVEFSDSGERQSVIRVPKIVKDESEWKKELAPATCAITRNAGTERPFTGQYWDQHEKGIYRCVCCGTALFVSDSKFDSGTGWPSFWQPIAKENIEVVEDRSYGMVRTEVTCRRCGAHLGHVFEDGPRPTGLRYCMNSASLKFIKSA